MLRMRSNRPDCCARANDYPAEPRRATVGAMRAFWRDNPAVRLVVKIGLAGIVLGVILVVAEINGIRNGR